MRHAQLLLRHATARLTRVLLEISIAAMLLGTPLGIAAALGAPSGALSMEPLGDIAGTASSFMSAAR